MHLARWARTTTFVAAGMDVSAYSFIISSFIETTIKRLVLMPKLKARTNCCWSTTARHSHMFPCSCLLEPVAPDRRALHMESLGQWGQLGTD